MKDLNHNDGNGTITVLRGFGFKEGEKYCVVQGSNWYKGLNDNYQEFDTYGEAVEYFNKLTK
jgi:hypothetical protein